MGLDADEVLAEDMEALELLCALGRGVVLAMFSVPGVEEAEEAQGVMMILVWSPKESRRSRSRRRRRRREEKEGERESEQEEEGRKGGEGRHSRRRKRSRKTEEE